MALSRRSLLTHTAAGCAVAAAAPCLAGCGFEFDPAPRVRGTLDDDPASPRYGSVAVALADHPKLAEVGGAVLVDIPTPAAGSRPFDVPADGLLLMHRALDGDTAFTALAALCPHAGCPLGYAPKEDLAVCPCHGSRFLPVAQAGTAGACAGAVVRGPAVAGVRAFAAALDLATRTVHIDLQNAPSCGDGVFTPKVDGGKVVLPIDQVPALGSAGGSWIGKPQGLADTLIVVRVDAGRAIALSAVCTHLQCLVQYDTPNTNILCACHQSKFDLDGNVVQAPATIPLKKYAATVDAQAVTVTV